MKKYGIIWVMVMFAVIALTAAPSFAGMDYSRHEAVRGSNLIGADVVNRDNEKIGTVDDIIIGLNGRTNYLILDHQGMLKADRDLVPVPLSAIDRKSYGKDQIVLDISNQELENAPSFARNEWPDFSDETYEQDVHGYYGETPSSKDWPDFEGGAWNRGEEPRAMPGSQGGSSMTD